MCRFGVVVTDGTATVSSDTHTTPDTTVTAANAVKPTPTKTPTVKPAAQTAGDALPDAPAKNGLPGFEGAVAVAGLFAVAYVVVRWKR